MAEFGGSDDGDTLAGGSENDTINGYGGNDFLTGGTGLDTIRGGTGNDRISGYTFGSSSDGDADQLFGEDGNDSILLGTGDSADGGSGDDVITVETSTGPASLIGGTGTDTLRVDNGSSISLSTLSGFERLEAASEYYGTHLTAAQFNSFATIAAIDGGTDVYFDLDAGGTGTMNFAAEIARATIYGSSAAESLTLATGSLAQLVYNGGSGNATVTAGGANDILEGGSGLDVLRGGSGNDRIAGYTIGNTSDGDADQLFGQDGNDYLYAGAGDSADGGTGNDVVTVYSSTGPASLIGGTGADTLRVDNGSSISLSTLSGFERLEAASEYYGTHLTAAQFNSFATIAAIDGGTDVYFDLDAGGTGTMNFAAEIARATIYGSSAAESLTLATGSLAQLVYNGGSGNATVTAGGANDILAGGSGVDVLSGGGGNDRMSGYTISYSSDGYADQLFGQDGNDYLYVSDGDSADGGTGNDVITVFGSTGPASLIGGTGTDTLRVDNGSSIALSAISGFERLEASSEYYGTRMTAAQFSSFATIDALDGANEVYISLYGGGTGTMTFDADIIRATVYGSSLAETLTLASTNSTQIFYEGGSGNSSITTRAGDDSLSGGYGLDTIRGGAGNDTLHSYTYYSSSDNSADSLFGEDGNDLLTLGNGDNGDGGAGNDTLIGSTGNETLTGGADFDTASYEDSYQNVTVNLNVTAAQNTGGGGTDLLTGIESLIGGSGDDTLTGTSGANIMTGSDGNDSLVGGSGSDTAGYANATAAVTVNLGTTAQQNTIGAGLDTLSSIENVIGGAGNDTLTGTGGDNVIEGGGGNDTISGLGGSDTASYASATGRVVVSLLTQGAQQNTVGAGLDTLSSIENLQGSKFGDTLTGDAGANRIEGLAGADNLTGEAGADTLIGGDGNDIYNVDAGDTITEVDNTAGGVDRVQTALSFTLAAALENLTLTGASAVNGTGNAKANSITGNDGANLLTGLAGADTLIGGVGNDTLVGGADADRFDGGTGADVFDFNLATESIVGASDVITAFEGAGAAAGDRIDLSNIDANTAVAGDNAFLFNSTAAGGLSLIASGTDTLLRGNTDADADFEFALLITDGATLSSAYTGADFIL